MIGTCNEHFGMRDAPDDCLACQADTEIDTLETLRAKVARLENEVRALAAEHKRQEADDDLHHFVIAPARHHGAAAALLLVADKITALVKRPI